MSGSPASWTYTLSSEYVPTQLMFRDIQLELLRHSIDDYLSHYYLEGPKSTGKTVTVKKFLAEVNQTDNHTSIYFCTDRAIHQEFERAVATPLGRRLKWRESPFHAIGDIPQEHIHFCIDDSQNVVHLKGFSPFLHSLFEHCLQHKKKLHLLLVGTMIYPKFARFIRDDVESRYRFKPILFEFYDPQEIEAIIKQRLDIIGIDYEPGAISFVSARIKRLVADLRLGFEILRNACQIADGAKITESIISKAWDKTKFDYWKAQIIQMADSLQVILLCTTVAAKNVTSTGPQPIITAHEILAGYRAYCERNELNPIYKQRLTFIFRKLEELGWLTQIKQRSKGRYGLDVEYRYEMNPSTILKAFEELHYEPEFAEPFPVADATKNQLTLESPSKPGETQKQPYIT
jgi:Cdc6-like AAA superfamily ATPase